MNRSLTTGIFALLVLLICGCSSATNEGNTPATGNNSATEPSSQRLVATTVAVTQIMDALEIDLVGVPTSYKELPKRYTNATSIGNPMSPDMEIIRSLKPSKVLSVSTLEYDLKPKFDNAGVATDYLDLTSLEKIKSTITQLGQQYDKVKQAETLVTKYDNKIAEMQKLVKDKEKPTVLVLMGVPGSYLVGTEYSYIGDLVKQLGGINVIQGETVEFLASNTEHLQKANPDIILRASHGMPEEVVKMFDKEFRQNNVWKHFKAVTNNRVYDLKEELFGTTGNLLADEALDELMEMLYP